ncbi:MAG TPA: DUF4058 family protein [Pirellulales bacterium]|nr:DUF4058 family protein [Pirellulales bacterium]
MSVKSPFPGMDPYLERHWRDVHHSLATYARDLLQPKLPAGLLARVEEQLFVESDEAPLRSIYPDVRVFEHAQATSPGAASSAVAAEENGEDGPFVLKVDHEPATEGFIEIREVGEGNRLITVIEFLSPSNKNTVKGRRLYRRKQRELRRARVSLVEIDLLRSGERVLSLPVRRLPQKYCSTYQVCVRRGWRSDEAEIYRVRLRAPLPKIKVPLRKKDPDVELNLQQLIEQCYANGRYDTLDYVADAEPPLDADDAKWADELLRAAGRR